MSTGFDMPLLQQLGVLSRLAGEAILKVYRGDFEVQMKSDHSPLTAADLAAQQVIMRGLNELDPGTPVVSEEARNAVWEQRRTWSRYWLVDPLDGTREFVKRNGEFSVNIALIEGHETVLGVVMAPVTGELYAAARNQGAWLQRAPEAAWERIHTRALAAPAILAGSRSHGGDGQRMAQRVLGEDYQLQPLGSSLKFCLIARGAADLYLRYGPTCEWDTAAAQCVLEEAGGAVTDLQGQALRYNRGESLINPEFMAYGDGRIDWAQRLRIAAD